MAPPSPPELDPEPPLEEPLPPLDDPALPLEEPDPSVQSQAPSCPLESHVACPVRLPWHEHTTVDPAEHVTPAAWLLQPACTITATVARPARPAKVHSQVDGFRVVMAAGRALAAPAAAARLSPGNPRDEASSWPGPGDRAIHLLCKAWRGER
jgi:hypothetical protein